MKTKTAATVCDALPWAQQMRDAATPDALKADRFVSFHETSPGMLELSAGDTTLKLNSKNLQVTLQKAGHAFVLRTPDDAAARLRDGSEHIIKLTDAGSVAISTEQWAGIFGIRLSLSGFSVGGRSADLKVILFAGLDYATGDAVFELRPVEEDTALRLASWPGAFAGDDVDATIVPHTSGLMIPRNWPKVIDAPYADCGKIGLAYGLSLYMPWWGVTRGGKSAMLIFETPDDAGIQLYHSPENGTTVSPKWIHSLGKMNYTRRARLKLVDGNYVAMARTYRRIAQENGTFRSTADKIAELPRLARLIGSPIFHVTARQYNVRSGTDTLFTPYAELIEKFERIQRQFGLRKAYIHVDGIGYRGYDNLEPDQIPVGEKAGGKEGLKKFLAFARENDYIVVYHQQYRDMYLDAPSYNKDLLLLREDGTHHIEDSWAGGANALVCTTRSLDYVRRNNTYLREIGAAPDGCYLDVFSAVSGDECYHHEHRMTRSDSFRLRRACFDYIRRNFGIVSSEEAADWTVRTLHLVHHTTWAVNPEYENFAIPLPLYALVYHDAMIVPFETGRRRGSYYYSKHDIPFLHALISAGMPYLSVDASAEDVEAAGIVAELHGRVALLEMTDHRQLSPDGRCQQAVYADGTVVTADQNSGDWSISYPGKTMRGNALNWSVETEWNN